MNKLDALNRVEEIINENVKSIISLVGKNATFKSTLLKDIYKKFSEKENYNILFLKAETTFSNEIKEKSSDIQFIGEIRKFINNFLSTKINIIDEQLIQKINQTKDFLANIKDYDQNDEYLKKEILESFTLNNDLLENKVNVEILPNANNSIKTYSSGQGMYSLLKFCSLVIKKSIENKNINNQSKKVILIIDEPEKHCHKSLIKKIFNIIYELFNLNIIIIFSTHSDYLLNEFISKFRIYNSNNYHLFNHNKPLNNDANIDEINIINKLNCNIVNKKTLNKREQGIIIASFFDENLFLVEGLKDYEFVNCLMQSKELNQYYYSVYDCEGKKNVIKLNDIIKDLNPNKNIFCFVDKDNDKSIQKNNFYVFEPNLEKEINDPYEKDKNNLEFYNLDNLKKYPLYNNCVNKLLDFFKKEINND